MSTGHHSPACVLIGLAALMVLLSTIYFASLRPGYSHISNSISELAEAGASPTRLLSFGVYLPVGLMVWLAMWLTYRGTREREVSLVLLAMSCFGIGYVVGALFPCDPGAPVFGSWRTLVHNVAAFIDYGGTGISFLLLSEWLARREATPQAAGFFAAGVLVLVCLAFLCFEATRSHFGAVQRVAEATQFAGMFFACSLIPRKATPTFGAADAGLALQPIGTSAVPRR